MATFTWSGSYGFDLRDLDLSGLADAYDYTRTSTVFAARYDAKGSFRDEFRGTGFAYDRDGVPVSGTVKSYAAIASGKKVGFIDGLNISVKSLVAAAMTYSTADDLKIFKSALAGNDRLTGGASGDKLEGFGGNDILYGKAGADKLYGGAGADTFVFKSTGDSTVSASGRDTIFDFTPSQKDRIDLHVIDANKKAAGDQAFSFIGSQSFHKKAGELRYEKYGTGVLVSGDVNGDGQADFSIYVKGLSTLSKAYFIL
ncbi:calcium-binding protein [Microvirga sp. TS319]|uniref:calcium-binding protein n=1 Tax=Microvirga sp. TS319 TaxID=3241165 RepID=UPI00351A9D4F